MMEPGTGKIQPADKRMSKSVKDKPAKKKPEWLRKLAEENLEEKNRAFESRCYFIKAKLDFEKVVEDINSKYGTKYQIENIFDIAPEEEEQAIDMLGLDDDED